MKRIILTTLIFWFFCLTASAQLKGEYVISYNGLGYKSYTFFKDNQFEYESFQCTSGEKSMGTYEIKDKEIIFYYERDTILNNTIEIDSFNNHDSIIIINLEIYDKETMEPLIAANVGSEDNLWAAVTDFDGQLKIAVHQSKVNNGLIISYTGYGSMPISIEKKYNYNIKAYLVYSWIKHPKVSSESFDFKRKKNNILIKPNYENGKFEEFIHKPISD